jgi:SAM-dependent methyltransferase
MSLPPGSPSPASPPVGDGGLTAAQRAATLERFRRHRVAWERNPALRLLYARWYGRIAELLEGAPPGQRVELGSGAGFSAEFIPGLLLTDLVGAPWHHREIGADQLPFAAGELAALVLFDVLHHLASPAQFFAEAERALAPGGLVVICDPYISPLSYPVYKLLHEEPVDLSARVLDLPPPDAANARDGARTQAQPGKRARAKDPFDSNQAIATLLFGRQRADFERRHPGLELISLEKMAGPCYVASGGFSHPPLLPMWIWRKLEAVERRLPRVLLDRLAFRLLAVLRKR